MNPGLLRHRITIQRRKAGQDCLGQPLDEWEDVGTVWAQLVESRAEPEKEYADRQVQSQKLVFRMRYNPAAKMIQEGDRVLWRGEVYEVEGTKEELDGRKRMLQLTIMQK